jgi:hypothetical protein
MWNRSFAFSKSSIDDGFIINSCKSTATETLESLDGMS